MTMQRQDAIGDATLRRILDRAATRVTKINETTRETIRRAVAEGVDRGEGAAQLGQRIAESAAFSEYRGELIARTETMFAWNASAIESYRDVGVQMVEPQDGDQDDKCKERMMRGAVPLDVALADEDHPNGTLSWSPVIAIDQLRRDVREAGWAGEEVSTASIDATVDRLVADATKAEQRVTADILDIGKRANLNPNAELTLENGKTVRTLDFRLKKPDSTFRKITGELDEQPGATIRAIEAEMRDNLRYTYVAEKGEYNAAIRAATDDLVARGYQPVKATNYWTQNGGYAGMNTNWKTADGQIFELQFHTQKGLETKELISHPLYEAQRVLRAGSRRWNELEDEIEAVWRNFRSDNRGLGNLPWLRDVFPVVKG